MSWTSYWNCVYVCGFRSYVPLVGTCAFNNDSHSHSTRNMLASSYAIEPTYSSFVRQVYGGGAANTDGSLATAEVHFPIGIASLPPSSDAFAFGDIFVVSASANLVQRLRWTSPTNGQ
eukprot:scaffold109016_cov19-Tisochrysis_lutea.AAC.1